MNCSNNLITDVPGLRVGNAADQDLNSGVTVVVCDTPMTASVHIMGGAPGTRDTELLAPDKTVQKIDALVLSGGSAFGLDACSGVVDALAQNNRGYPVGNVRVPIVPGAILFDLLNGGDKNWKANPYSVLGKMAFEAASDTFALGTAGAGYGALTADFKGGLGSASATLGKFTVAALVAVNPVGSAVSSAKGSFWAAPFEQNNEFGGRPASQQSGHNGLAPQTKATLLGTGDGNTTIAIVATDADLTKAECYRLAIAAHDGIARAIVPAHTPQDGDLIFALSSGQKPLDRQSPAQLSQLGSVAAVCLSRAIARGVYAAQPHSADILPTWAATFG
ncbi:MAG: P1 family peptidase [Rhodobacteraceae bacterium]|nr:P1 family peptidase [Paracoccaceae bacterium]PHR55649.1 MAG: peptidase T4 [Robiginitomaculum sp.]